MAGGKFVPLGGSNCSCIDLGTAACIPNSVMAIEGSQVAVELMSMLPTPPGFAKLKTIFTPFSLYTVNDGMLLMSTLFGIMLNMPGSALRELFVAFDKDSTGLFNLSSTFEFVGGIIDVGDERPSSKSLILLEAVVVFEIFVGIIPLLLPPKSSVPNKSRIFEDSFPELIVGAKLLIFDDCVGISSKFRLSIPLEVIGESVAIKSPSKSSLDRGCSPLA